MPHLMVKICLFRRDYDVRNLRSTKRESFVKGNYNRRKKLEERRSFSIKSLQRMEEN